MEMITILFTLLSWSVVTHKRRICTQVKLLQYGKSQGNQDVLILWDVVKLEVLNSPLEM